MNHTADMGIRVWGEDWKEMLEQAARGMVTQIIELGSVSVREERELEIQGESGEELILNWLREILLLIEGGMVFSTFRVKNDNFTCSDVERYRFTGVLGGEEFDPTRHDICTEMKAVTRHGLLLKKRGTCWETFILFDV